MQFLQALEPLFCILSAIDHIILPHQYLQMEQVRRRLSRKEMDRPRLWHTLLSSLCLPFPILRLVSNYSLPTRPYKAASPERRDWVVHAHFGDFKHGVVELPASTHAGVCEPGTVTASMARYIPHGFPPVTSERFILTQVFCNPLLDYVGLHNLPIGASPSVENVEAAATTEDTRFVYMEEIDNVVYRWNSSRLKAHWCSCCWGQPTNLKPW